MSALRSALIFCAGAVLSLRAQTSIPTVSHAITPQVLAPGASATLDLRNFFSLPGVTGQVVQFDTVLGKFNVELRPDAAPQHVANFLGYVQRGDYSNSFFHRTAIMDQSGAIGIVQGGGFVVTSSGVANIPTQAPVPLEYNLPNERGTLAAARMGDVNSATSQWYFNVRDNTSALGSTNGGGYTVFGRVIGSGMSVLDAIANLGRVNAGGAFTELPVRDYSGGDIQVANLVIVNSTRVVPVFPSGTSSGVINFTVESSAPNIVFAGIAGSDLVLNAVGSGSSTITVRATDANGNTTSSTFLASVTTAAPTFTVQPRSLTLAVGNTAVLNGTVTGATSYQWQRNGADVAGATSASLVIPNVASGNAGTYTLIARNPNGSTTSNALTLTVTNPAPDDVGRLVNLSVRTNAGTGDQTLIVGFAVGGEGTSGTVPLLLRGMGPTLGQYGVPGFLADPVATLYSGNTSIATNDNWSGDSQVATRVSQVQAFNFASTTSLDAALAISPTAGGYTMQVTGKGSATGTVLAEIYDANITGGYTAASPRLINVSARALAGSGDGTLITGFVIRGTTARTVLIRAAGPALAAFGVSGTISDPKLQVYPLSSSTLVAENDNWGGDTQVAAAASTVSAFPWSNGGSADAALLVTLPPGGYTAQVTGANGGTGIALVEVYEVR